MKTREACLKARVEASKKGWRSRQKMAAWREAQAPVAPKCRIRPAWVRVVDGVIERRDNPAVDALLRRLGRG